MTAYTFDQIIDFTRTSAATYVANTGFVTQTPASRNLLTYTQEFDNAAWTKTRALVVPNVNPATATLGAELVTNGDFASGTGWTANAGWAIGSGTATATSTSTSLFGGGFTPTAGRLYRVDFDVVSYTSGTLSITVGANYTGESSLTGGAMAAGRKTVYVVSGTNTSRGVEFYGGAISAVIDNVSVREVVGGALQAPDGTFTADKVIATAESGYHAVRIAANPGTASIQTFSFYAKAAEYTRVHLGNLSAASWGAAFDLSNGTVIGTYDGGIGPSITAVGNGWYRCAVTFRGAASGWSYGIIGYPAGATLDSLGAQYTGDGVSGIFIWGAQLEAVPDANLVLGSEIRSTGSIVTVGTVTAGSYNTSTGEAVLPRVDGANLNQVVFASTSGKNYRVDIQNTGAVAISVRSGSTILTTVAAGQRATVYAVVAAPQNLSIWPNGDAATATATIHSVKEITGTVGMPSDYTRNVGGVYPPRFDYDPVTLAPRGLLIEEQRTNLLTYSEQFDNGFWVKTNATISANATASPDGTTNADSLIENTANGAHDTYNSATLTAAAHTFSVYVKPNGRTWISMFVFQSGGPATETWFNLSNGTLGTVGAGATAAITNAGNGWYRCSITFTALAAAASAYVRMATGNNVATYTGDGTSGIYLWGAQLEAGAFATSYIPTVASQVTRTADVATVTGANFSRWYNQSEGTLLIEANVSANVDGATGNYYATLSDGTISNTIHIAEINGMRSQIITGGVVNFDETVGSEPTGTVKAALAYATNNTVSSANGAIGSTDTSVSLPTVNRLNIGVRGDLNNSTTLNGHIRRIRYYPTRLSNTQLQALTA